MSLFKNKKKVEYDFLVRFNDFIEKKEIAHERIVDKFYMLYEIKDYEERVYYVINMSYGDKPYKQYTIRVIANEDVEYARNYAVEIFEYLTKII